MSDDLKRDALAYHAVEPAGKLQILPTKPMATQRDLALAYSPGVAYACEEIAADPATAALYTGRANTVAVISNGTAVLGLGNIGALASKPVMEGKAALFKKFSGIDTVDLKGRGFQALVQQGEGVHAGHPLLRIDTGVIRGAGYSPITPVIVLNNEHASIEFE